MSKPSTIFSCLATIEEDLRLFGDRPPPRHAWTEIADRLERFRTDLAELQTAVKEVAQDAEKGDGKATRNCDRFNTGNAAVDLVAALKHFASETGTPVSGISPGFNCAGDFALWLLSNNQNGKENTAP